MGAIILRLTVTALVLDADVEAVAALAQGAAQGAAQDAAQEPGEVAAAAAAAAATLHLQVRQCRGLRRVCAR